MAVMGRGMGRERRQGPTETQEDKGESTMEEEEERECSDVKEAVTFAGACKSEV